MADIAISAATRTTLLAAQRSAALANRTAQRLATGRRVNGPLDAAAAFFAGRSLRARAGDLLAVKDRIGQGASAIGAAIAGTSALNGLLEQAKAVALTARGGSASERQEAAQRFDEIRTQIDNLAGDVSFLGRNLLATTPSQLTVPLNEDGSSSLTVSGVASGTAGLGVDSGVADFASFASDTDIDAAVQQLDDARAQLRSTAETLGSNIAILNVREEFSAGLANILEQGAASLTQADLNEEAARQLSLELRSELAVVAQSIAQRNDQAFLDLL